jgi:hypothetical protein
MMNDDELDRALFALPLAEPPAGLRASILALTVHAPRPMMRTWETVTVGIVLALVAWLALSVLTAGGPIETLVAQTSSALTGVFTNRETLLWLALGGATVLLANVLDPRLVLRRRS